MAQRFSCKVSSNRNPKYRLVHPKTSSHRDCDAAEVDHLKEADAAHPGLGERVGESLDVPKALEDEHGARDDEDHTAHLQKLLS